MKNCEDGILSYTHNSVDGQKLVSTLQSTLPENIINATKKWTLEPAKINNAWNLGYLRILQVVMVVVGSGSNNGGSGSVLVVL